MNKREQKVSRVVGLWFSTVFTSGSKVVCVCEWKKNLWELRLLSLKPFRGSPVPRGQSPNST